MGMKGDTKCHDFFFRVCACASLRGLHCMYRQTFDGSRLFVFFYSRLSVISRQVLGKLLVLLVSYISDTSESVVMLTHNPERQGVKAITTISYVFCMTQTGIEPTTSRIRLGSVVVDRPTWIREVAGFDPRPGHPKDFNKW